MISIIICSRKKSIDSNLDLNIHKTIGCDYELIVINNSRSNYSIFEAYNKGIKESKGEFLCFIHDDILIQTKDWGKKIIRIFETDNKIGLIGIAGSKIKTKMPSSWSDCDEKYKVINVIQHFNDANPQKMECGFRENKTIEEVVAIDGVFIAARKIKGLIFNTNLKGFHNYDLSISLDFKIKGFRNIVTNEILIEHFSLGTIDKSWYESALKLDELYKKHLPLSTDEFVSKKNINNRELINGAAFVSQLFKYGYIKQAFKYWIKLVLIKPYSKYHFILLKKAFKF
tara:strand:+ start:1653 stop:2507 length:855 start_codon:yes stop_codon:yes gene_type:complete